MDTYCCPLHCELQSHIARWQVERGREARERERQGEREGEREGESVTKECVDNDSPRALRIPINQSTINMVVYCEVRSTVQAMSSSSLDRPTGSCGLHCTGAWQAGEGETARGRESW
jgi:hypothetical protein